MIACKFCDNPTTRAYGKNTNGSDRRRCPKCKKTFNVPGADADYLSVTSQNNNTITGYLHPEQIITQADPLETLMQNNEVLKFVSYLMRTKETVLYGLNKKPDKELADSRIEGYIKPLSGIQHLIYCKADNFKDAIFDQPLTSSDTTNNPQRTILGQIIKVDGKRLTIEHKNIKQVSIELDLGGTVVMVGDDLVQEIVESQYITYPNDTQFLKKILRQAPV